MKHLIFCVTNNLSFDQRMMRFCTTLSENYKVTLIGRDFPKSVELPKANYQQKRIKCWVNKGPLFYLEFNLRLWWKILFIKFDVLTSIDTDTLIACKLASKLKGKPMVFDAHEFFTEMPELVNRPKVKAIWRLIENLILPKQKYSITVTQGVAELFEAHYGIKPIVIRNVPFLENPIAIEVSVQKKIIYQGALNLGRGLETAILAMHHLPNIQLLLAGEGDLSESLRKLVKNEGLSEKVIFLGYVPPSSLKKITQESWIGINLLAPMGLNYYHSLANKFLDYIQAGKPQISMDFPEYKRINKEFLVAELLPNLSVESYVQAVKSLEIESHYQHLRENALEAAKILNWKNESILLLDYYAQF